MLAILIAIVRLDFLILGLALAAFVMVKYFKALQIVITFNCTWNRKWIATFIIIQNNQFNSCNLSNPNDICPTAVQILYAYAAFVMVKYFKAAQIVKT